jgi:hypothetical protein
MNNDEGTKTSPSIEKIKTNRIDIDHNFSLTELILEKGMMVAFEPSHQEREEWNTPFVLALYETIMPGFEAYNVKKGGMKLIFRSNNIEKTEKYTFYSQGKVIELFRPDKRIVAQGPIYIPNYRKVNPLQEVFTIGAIYSGLAIIENILNNHEDPNLKFYADKISRLKFK